MIVHDKIQLRKFTQAPLSKVWAAFADTTQRAQWGVPMGEELVYDRDDFQVGGRAGYRCGPPGDLRFQVSTEYLVIEEHALVIHTESVRSGGRLLAAGVIAWQFSTASHGSAVAISHHLTSTVGQEMIDGSRNGHTIALNQLASLVER